MDSIPTSSIEPGGVAPTQIEFLHSNLDTFPSLPFFRSKSTRTTSFQSGPLSSLRDGMLVLKNKSPRWHEQLQCWCLNFNGRVTVASVKNFQLVASTGNVVVRQEQKEDVILQFGKVGKDVFTMDYQYPISAFQAFAICLSSFDTKIACEWIANRYMTNATYINAFFLMHLYTKMFYFVGLKCNYYLCYGFVILGYEVS